MSTSTSTSTSAPSPGIVVCSGGSAANNLVDVFDSVAHAKACQLSYIIPISDNGGSSSELLRVFGGPSVGDVRSRLVRLIPSDPSNSERTAIKAFFNHRLPSNADLARIEWHSIIESRSELWRNISSSKRELIRSFLLHLHHEILKRARPPSHTFSFQAAAVGNLFLTGARLFCGSFEAAVYLLSSITGVSEHVQVLPAVNSNFTHHISAGLRDGSVVVGQNAISHPSARTALPEAITSASTTASTSTSTSDNENEDEEEDNEAEDGADPPEEDANLPGSLPSLRRQNIAFSKTMDEPLPARIERIWYINPFGHEIRPPANPRVLDALRAADSIVYSIGSLYTSIIPCLILKGVGDAISSLSSSSSSSTRGKEKIRKKILILNGTLDRETSATSITPAFTATEFVLAITRACLYSRTSPSLPLASIEDTSVVRREVKNFVSHVLHLPSSPHNAATDIRSWHI
ncbi:MAG: hypothetical protein M1838_003466 [Thelocarpon superellum]|nr:MAG: hypothetical protein M1838_003466 [Thelocarpon superellum]